MTLNNNLNSMTLSNQSTDYKVGDRVWYYSIQRGGIWQPATVIKILDAGLEIKMDNSILEIKVWQPQTELYPIVAQ